MAPHHEQIDYVEYPACDMAATKAFFTTVFEWRFTDFGPDYMAFDRHGIEGGFYKSDKSSNSDKGAALIIFYSASLEATKAKIIQHGGQIKTDIYAFPGGRRFHFTCPSGNEFAVWSDKVLA
ncbi:MAG: VOC family protein [Candidatus Puniceispirillaceae bacterium]